MLSVNEILDLIANTFFDGNVNMAGIVMYIAVLVLVITVSKNVFYALLIGMAATLLFTTMGILSTEIAVLLIIVSVLGLAYTARSIWRD